MGKKTKKTKWRTLEISLPVSGKNYHENGPNLRQLDDGWCTSYSYDKYRRSTGYDKIIKASASASACDAKSSSVEQNHTKAQIEDEYTKITTPRQDVLFKKGYLTRRKTPRHTCDENIADSFASNETVNLGGIQAQADCASVGDQEFREYASMTTDGGSCLSSVQPQSHSQQLLCATSQPYIDASTAAIYYGGGYEIYDPYTGSVTALVVGATSTANSAAATAAAAAASCQPILTSMPCRPVPLQSLQWFNPVPSSSEWCCDANATTTANAASSYAAVVDDADAGDGDGDDSIAKASHSDDSTNSSTSASASESSPMAENTILKTGVDVPMYSPHPSQSYIYPSYVFETAVYSVEDDGGTNIRYYSPESPILSSNESAITKRKKRRKRRRRFGETEDDSESGVEENHDEYVFSCENQVVDYAYDEYKDNDELAATVDVQNQTNSSSFGSQSTLHDHGGLHYTSLPRASINAPPFVPANRGGGGAQTPLFADDRSRCRSNDQYVDVDEVETKSPSSTSINAVDSKMRRESFVDGRSKSLTDSPSSSNNSDSGISSPGIEDRPSVGQLQEYRKSVQADRSRTSFNNLAAITPVTQNSGDCDAVAIVSAAAAATTAAAAALATAAALSPDDKTKICDSSCASAESKCARDDKPSKKIRAKNTSNRVKRCHSKNEERNLKRGVSGRELHARIDESVDCAQSVAVCDQEPQSAAENRSKKSSKVETTPQIEQVADDDFDENWTADRGSCDDCSIVVNNCETTKCHLQQQTGHERDTLIENKCASACETHSSPKDENCRDKCENALARTRVARPPEEAQNDASSRPRLHPFENHAEICDQTDACFANTVAALSDQLDQNDATAWSPKTNVDASERTSQDRSVSENVAYSAATVTTWSSSSSKCRSEHVAKVARIIVDEIVQQAESQIRMSTTKCDKLQLPLTQAVTNWLNQRGGLPAVVDGLEIENRRRVFPRQPPSDESADAETTASRRSQSKKPVEKSTASSSNCVIC